LENHPGLDGISLREVIESDSIHLRNRPIGFQSAYRNTFMTAWSDDRFKLVSKDDRESYELYDILVDPYEEKDISAEFPEVVRAMALELDAWLSSFDQ